MKKTNDSAKKKKNKKLRREQRGLGIKTIKFLIGLNVFAFLGCLYGVFCSDNFFYPLQYTYHIYSEWETVLDATCTEYGYMEKECLICHDKVIRYIEPLGHSYVADVEEEATIYGDGTFAYTCFRCGDSYSETIPALTATYTRTFVSPVQDPEGIGYVLYTCDQDESVFYTEELTYTVRTIAPTCVARGYTVHECNEGDYSYITDYVDTINHNWIEVSYTSPNCEDTGAVSYVCEYCNASKVIWLDIIGHNYKKVEGLSRDATCEEAGFLYEVCTRCGKVRTTVLPALGHDYVDGVCTRDGAIDPDWVDPDAPSEEDPDLPPNEDPDAVPEAKPEENPEAIPEGKTDTELDGG